MLSATPTCQICSGGLDLLYPGSGEGARSADFSPTCHTLGEHGDLFRCHECGTVQQPSLPAGGELHEIYRSIEDDAYLAEEEGRRATARRLLDLIGRYHSAGRLLEVGCGHGLLLDEARRRGYEVSGVELSAAAVGYARDVLGLDVREQPLEAVRSEEGFDAIVMADVIEHLDDPLAALDQCRDLLAPGGVLCVVTPDPSAAIARVAGRRWWGYLPAHTFLMPRLTLRELLGSRGLVVSDDVGLVRTFSARYWIGGLAHLASALRPPLSAVKRLLGDRVSLTLSLGDERVMLAHKVEALRPPKPLVQDRGGRVKVHVVLPAYKAERTIPDVAKNLPVEHADRALLVDDSSPDETTPAALGHGFEVIAHPANRGYGANQKTCYTRAVLDGADVVVMVHADNQYDPSLLPEMVEPILSGEADVVIGSRLLEDETIAGGMPRWKWVGNRFLTGLENLAFRRSYSEYHTGYRAFSAEFLRTVPFLRNSDGFVFDQEIFTQVVARGARVVEIAIPTRYFLEASSVPFWPSVEYGLRTLYVLWRFRVDARFGRWPLLRRPAARLQRVDQRDDVSARS
jgi:SAM-dependent methyltransferase/glycosyltransferase involved in cell wall biosynthesis